MKLKILALAAAGAAMLAAGVQARDAEPIMAPYDAAYAVDPAKLPSVCAAGSNAKLYLKFGDTVLATPRAAVTTFTPMRVAVVKDNDVPIGFSFPADSGCAENPIVVARADVRLEGRAEPLLLATSTTTGGLSGAAKSVIYLRDKGRCPKEGKFAVCKGKSRVNDAEVETWAFIGEQEVGATPSGEPYFALCEGSRSQAACEVSDELAPGLSFRIKLPKGQPQIEAIKAVHAEVRALLASMTAS